MAAPHWTERSWLAVDTETTGVDCFNDRVVEVAVVEIDVDGTALNPWSTVVDPGIEIPEGAAAIHGITTERARAEGTEPATAIEIVADRIFEAGPMTPVVMFNARFDWPLLLTEADRHSIEFPVFAPILDPYLVDRMMDRYRKGKRQLTLVADHYGVELGDAAHGALADAIAAGRVMRKLVERYPAIGEHPLAGVWLRQVRGHEVDRQRFIDYMRTQVDPAFDSPPGWPIPAGATT